MCSFKHELLEEYKYMTCNIQMITEEKNITELHCICLLKSFDLSLVLNCN